MTRGLAKFRVYEDRGGTFRWRLVEANGRIIADSAEGYDSRDGAKAAVARLRASVPTATLELDIVGG